MNTIVGPSQAGTAVRATLNGLLDPIALAAITKHLYVTGM